MAFRTAVKASLLLDEEEPRARLKEAGAIPDAPPPPVAMPPLENPKPENPKPENPKPRGSGDALRAAAWHQRAEALCAMAETLPSKSSWSLISKIAALYDEIARDAGWCEEEAEEAAPPPEAPRLEEPRAADELGVDEPLADESPAVAPPPAPSAPERLAFPRRPLRLRPAMPRRRA